MFDRYAAVLRRPGAARFSAAGLVGRMQLSMAGLGSVLLLSSVRGSYALAGIVSALYGLSQAAIGPLFSRYIDMLGQRRVVWYQLGVHVPAMAALVAVAVFTPLTWPLFGLAVIAGAAQPQLGSLVRTRWSAALRDSPDLRTAYAWESLIDEVVFIVGPPLATIVALQLFPSAALVLATTLLTVGTILLLVQTGTEPAPAGRHQIRGGRPAVFLPGVAGLAAIFMLIGGVFGSFEVTTVAFAKTQGHPGAAGVLLALYSAGSLLAGLVFGALTLRASLLRQFMVTVLALAVVTLPLPFLGNVWIVGAGLTLAGLACAPALISGTALLERLVPGHRLTEALSWISSGMALGISMATPLAGRLIDAAGPSSAYLVTSGCAVGAAAVALLVRPAIARVELNPLVPADTSGLSELGAVVLEPALSEAGTSTRAAAPAARN